MHGFQGWARGVACLLPLALACCQVDDARQAQRAEVHAAMLPPTSSNRASVPALQPAKLEPQFLVSAASPFSAGCDRENSSGTNYVNAEVEPSLALHPLDGNRMVGVWQQDRWSNGSSRGVMSATSSNGGQSWTRRAIPFSRCGGGTLANGGDFARVSNPWVAYGQDGVVHAVGLASSGAVFTAGSDNAIVASRSLDGGLSWSNPVALIRDSGGFFNDKVAVTADPQQASRVYAVWDRLVAGDNGGPTYLARSLDSGAHWQPARPIYDPGPASQTISNVIVVLRDGSLVCLFVQIDYVGDTYTARIAVIRSLDKGDTWTGPSTVADLQPVGTRDPNSGVPVRDQAIVPQIAAAPSGAVYVVWQDARFNAGAYDAIAISRSLDGGANWMAPRRVSAPAGVAAFNPAVHVRHDGTVGVSYYDFRSDGIAATLLTDTWLAHSSDGGATWADTRIADPFDIAIAPRTNAPFNGGYFLGDYQTLTSRDDVFIPFFAKANNANTSNRTDIFIAPTPSSVFVANGRVRSDCGPPRRAALAPSTTTPTTRSRISANLEWARQERWQQTPAKAGPRSRHPAARSSSGP